MRRIIVIDATGSMSGRPLEACLEAAIRDHGPDAEALVHADADYASTRTRLGRIRPRELFMAGGCGDEARMLREIALVADEVHYYTDGNMNGNPEVLPPGRVTIHLHEASGSTIRVLRKMMPDAALVRI